MKRILILLLLAALPAAAATVKVTNIDNIDPLNIPTGPGAWVERDGIPTQQEIDGLREGQIVRIIFTTTAPVFEAADDGLSECAAAVDSVCDTLGAEPNNRIGRSVGDRCIGACTDVRVIVTP